MSKLTEFHGILNAKDARPQCCASGDVQTAEHLLSADVSESLQSKDLLGCFEVAWS